MSASSSASVDAGGADRPTAAAAVLSEKEKPAAAVAADSDGASAASPSQQPDMSKYGTHDCTCDGCNAKPINGFRYKCLRCKDHDICESCHHSFTAGSLPHSNRLNPLQSRDVSAHAFATYAEGKSFRAIGGVKRSEPLLRRAAKLKPNDPCSCGSGKKYKRCHFMQQ